MIDWDIVWRDDIGISWSGAVGVAVSAVVLHLLFTLLVQLSGQRPMANPTVGSFVVLALICGVTARAALGEAPTLLGALRRRRMTERDLPDRLRIQGVNDLSTSDLTILETRGGREYLCQKSAYMMYIVDIMHLDLVRTGE